MGFDSFGLSVIMPSRLGSACIPVFFSLCQYIPLPLLQTHQCNSWYKLLVRKMTKDKLFNSGNFCTIKTSSHSLLHLAAKRHRVLREATMPFFNWYRWEQNELNSPEQLTLSLQPAISCLCYSNSFHMMETNHHLTLKRWVIWSQLFQHPGHCRYILP